MVVARVSRAMLLVSMLSLSAHELSSDLVTKSIHSRFFLRVTPGLSAVSCCRADLEAVLLGTRITSVK